jgi:hypothetical protein
MVRRTLIWPIYQTPSAARDTYLRPGLILDAAATLTHHNDLLACTHNSVAQWLSSVHHLVAPPSLIESAHTM